MKKALLIIMTLLIIGAGVFSVINTLKQALQTLQIKSCIN